MTTNLKNYAKEYCELESVFGKHFMDLMFSGLSGYLKVREENTFYEIRDELISIYNTPSY